MFHFIIFYGSYLSFPFLLFLVLLTWKRWDLMRKNKLFFLAILFFYLLTGFFIYARFIEPNRIVVNEHQIETGFEARVIVMADMHLGQYKGADFMERVVERVNEQEDIQAILIPGDFTYYPKDWSVEALNDMFSSLSQIQVPVYAVLGNHDSEQPGPPLQENLEKALEKNGVIFMNNESDVIPGTDITVLGLGDYWAKEDDIRLIENYTQSDHLIVMTHNPDTTLNYKNSIPDLTVSGHTHGGQIRIPWLYKRAIPCTGDFDKDLHETPTGKLFVTSGLGEVGLPMRLWAPPVIDVLEFY